MKSMFLLLQTGQIMDKEVEAMPFGAGIMQVFNSKSRCGKCRRRLFYNARRRTRIQADEHRPLSAPSDRPHDLSDGRRGGDDMEILATAEDTKQVRSEVPARSRDRVADGEVLRDALIEREDSDRPTSGWR